MESNSIDLLKISGKWQNIWKETGLNTVGEGSDKPKYYALDMFPYPSGVGLHMGHPKGFSATDVLSRKKLLEGYNVLHPMGFDAFGLPAEQYAIKNKMHPKVSVDKNIQTFISQLEKIGFYYDRNRIVNTTDPKFYKWTQWIFLQLYNHYFDENLQKALPISELEKQGKSTEFIDSQRLAYIDYKPIIWCPTCKTGLANEDLENGKCERCESEIERKPMKQWVLRITKYAERMLDGLNELDGWAQNIVELQKNWIGKSQGTEFEMKVKNTDKSFSVFTTRIDTVFGMSFVAIAPEHPLVEQITSNEHKEQVLKYVNQSKSKTDLQRTDLAKDKTGVFCGAYAINPFSGKEIPIFVADYVLYDYGTGVVMAVPAHDERDYEFAKKYDLEIKYVIKSINGEEDGNVFTKYGILVDSGEFSGLNSQQAIEKMSSWLEQKGIGERKVNYKIQDWVFSRQRYWGEPIPVIHCEKCGIVPLQENDLPLLLPQVDKYEPTGSQDGPLANITEWIEVECPICGNGAKRESNTMPQWAGSSWYWLRYMDPNNENYLVDKDKEKYWGQVDYYVGGAEHATRHLIYARFWHKFLYDIGVVSTQEPFKRLMNVGMLLAEDGRKMSKRWGNIINPDEVVKIYGPDILRTYLLFMGPFNQEVSWNSSSIKGIKKFYEKIIGLLDIINSNEENGKIVSLLHKTIKKVGEDIDNFKFNTAISQIMIFVNQLIQQGNISKKTMETLILLISPFAPHLAEELWEKIGNKYSVFTSGSWPKYDEKLIIVEDYELAVQFNGKTRGSIIIPIDLDENEIIKILNEHDKFGKYMKSQIKKVIFVKGRIINIIF